MGDPKMESLPVAVLLGAALVVEEGEDVGAEADVLVLAVETLPGRHWK